MNIKITGRQIDITPALKERINSKFGKLTHHFEQITSVHVILSVEKNLHRAEITVHASGAELFAHDEAIDMYAAIDGLVKKIDTQLLKHKNKLKDHSGCCKHNGMHEAETEE